MKPPPVRYPLPTIVGLGLAALVVWGLRDVARSAWQSVAFGVSRVVEGPPVPESDEPKPFVDGIPRRGLLLREKTPARARPDGAVVETIERRGFVEIYDEWPLEGEPTHVRVGNNGRAIGWIKAGAILNWPTRLVRKPDETVVLANEPTETPQRRLRADGNPLPILEWQEGVIREAVWRESGPWSEVETSGWEPLEQVEQARLGVLLSREELLELMKRLLAGDERADQPLDLRLKAVTGELFSNRPWSKQSRRDLRRVLPGWVYEAPVPDRDEALNSLGRLNDLWRPAASWEGLEFGFVPLTSLP